MGGVPRDVEIFSLRDLVCHPRPSASEVVRSDSVRTDPGLEAAELLKRLDSLPSRGFAAFAGNDIDGLMNRPAMVMESV